MASDSSASHMKTRQQLGMADEEKAKIFAEYLATVFILIPAYNNNYNYINNYIETPRQLTLQVKFLWQFHWLH